MATEQDKANLGAYRGRQAAQIKDSEERKKYIADTANVDKDYDATANATAVKDNEIKTQQVLGSLKKGGPIKKTGLYKLHKGEHVVPKEDNPMASSHTKIPKHGVKSSHTQHHHDGTHTVTHQHHDGSESSHALPDVSALNDHMASVLSPEPQEEGGMQAPPEAAAAGAAGPAGPMA